MPEPAHKRKLTLTVYATALMTPTTALGLSIRLSMLELRETGDWDISFLKKISGQFFSQIGQDFNYFS